MASSATKRLTVLSVLSVLSLAAERVITQPSSVQIIAPVIAGDSAGHLDLTARDTAQLRAVARDRRGDSIVAPVRWSSSDVRVATITSSGLVRARGRGYAMVTATVEGISARLRVCVTARARESLAWSVASLRVTVAAPAYVGQATQATAHATLKPESAIAWGQCVHWSVDSTARAFASIDRAGVLHTSRSVSNIVAAVGPELPQ